MVRVVNIPWVAGRYTIGSAGQYTMSRGVDITWVGWVNIPWVGGSIFHR
jgi:hypothetical protein